MKALVGAFNQEKALVGAFSVIVQPVVEPMDRFAALLAIESHYIKSLHKLSKPRNCLGSGKFASVSSRLLDSFRSRTAHTVGLQTKVHTKVCNCGEDPY